MNTEVMRRFYARLVTSVPEAHPRLTEAFATIKREEFVGSGPWQIPVQDGYMSTETDDPVVLYQDIGVGLIPERRINNGQPSLHALCMAAASVQEGDVVIHIGAGTGYYTAILASLVGPSGRVVAYEIDAELARAATSNLASYATVSVRRESAVSADLPTANVVYVSAGVTDLPANWLDAVAPDGRLVVPLTPEWGLGGMLLVTHHPTSHYAARMISTAGFIPCVGASDEHTAATLAAAFKSRSPEEIRSLRRGTEPDQSMWFAGDGWWLSTTEVGVR
ncbi:MAG: rRNA adenine N-6-methyltransferase family protein [Vicinamibacterales bacterium]